jgi:hypothetical protein
MIKGLSKFSIRSKSPLCSTPNVAGSRHFLKGFIKKNLQLFGPLKADQAICAGTLVCIIDHALLFGFSQGDDAILPR